MAQNNSPGIDVIESSYTVRSNTCDAGSGTNFVVLDASASSTDEAYAGMKIALSTGESDVIVSYNGTTKIATVQHKWDVIPTDATTFVITQQIATSYLVAPDRTPGSTKRWMKFFVDENGDAQISGLEDLGFAGDLIVDGDLTTRSVSDGVGNLRMTENDSAKLQQRNAALSAWVNLVFLNNSDQVILGQTSVPAVAVAGFKGDTIDERTAAAGVTVDGVLLKDGVFNYGSAGIATLAALGSIQGDAAPIVAGYTYVTDSDGTKGVVLPTAVAGLRRVVYNTVASQPLKVYPNTSDDLNNGSTNAPILLAGKSVAVFEALDATTWTVNGMESIISADTINEVTPAAGVTADSVLLKDGSVTIIDGGTLKVSGTTTGLKIVASASDKLGFWGTTPVVRSTGWSAATNVTTTKTFNADSFTLDELADYVGTLGNWLLTAGIIGA